jgi:hypothetical protein
MLRIHGPDCPAGEGTNDAGCFVKDGEVGTLDGDQFFAALDQDEGGKLYAVTGRASPRDSCTEGCRVQRIDVATRTLETDVPVPGRTGTAVVARHDAVSGSLVVGFLTGDRGDDAAELRHQVLRLRYE